jgi:hypothetical protein
MEHNPSWETDSRSASRTVPCLLWNRTVHYGRCSQDLAISPSPAWGSLIQSIPSNNISLISILVLSSHLRLGILFGLFHSGFLTKILYVFLISPMCTACSMLHASHPPWFHNPNNIWWRVRIMKLFVMQISPASCHCLLLRSKHSPRNFVLEHRQSVFFP